MMFMRWSIIALALLQTACSWWTGPKDGYSLVHHFSESQIHFEDGRYPSFVARAAPVTDIDISDDVRPSLTPPFPSRIVYRVDVPPAAFLYVAPALRMTQQVTRARVEFLILVEANGEAPVRVYVEELRMSRAARWHDRQVDLTAWSGKTVALHLETRPLSARGNILWADRIQTVWGDPVVVSSRAQQMAAIARRTASRMIEWTKEQSTFAGLRPEDARTAIAFALNLIIGGFAALFIRELYKRYGTSNTNREAFGNIFPVFTLTAIVVIFIVQFSLALSLGLIGALSIVRFRTAIKSSEELAYLLFCVSVGIALAASQRTVAFVALLVVTAFVLGRRILNRPFYERNLLLVVSGAASNFFPDEHSSVIERLNGITEGWTLHRLDCEGDEVKLRAFVTIEKEEDPNGLLEKLRESLPSYEFSFIEVENLT
jgi:hypothetical protein